MTSGTGECGREAASHDKTMLMASPVDSGVLDHESPATCQARRFAPCAADARTQVNDGGHVTVLFAHLWRACEKHCRETVVKMGAKEYYGAHERSTVGVLHDNIRGLQCCVVLDFGFVTCCMRQSRTT